MSESRYGHLVVRLYQTLIDPLVQSLRPKISRICVDIGARDVLDIASATGAQCRSLGQLGINATGIDLSEEMVAAARQRGGRNVRYVQGSAYDLPVETESFDASLLVLALHEHSEEARAVMISEALRVLRPQGFLVVADYVKPAHSRISVPWQFIRMIETVAGSEHRQGFNDFIERGGLGGLLNRYRLDPTQKAMSHAGTIEIAAVQLVTGVDSSSS